MPKREKIGKYMLSAIVANVFREFVKRLKGTGAPATRGKTEKYIRKAYLTDAKVPKIGSAKINEMPKVVNRIREEAKKVVQKGDTRNIDEVSRIISDNLNATNYFESALTTEGRQRRIERN